METPENKSKRLKTQYNRGVFLVALGFFLGLMRAFGFPSNYETIVFSILGGIFSMAIAMGWDQHKPK